MPTDAQRYHGMVQAYETVFTGPLGQQVLEDLERANFVHKTTFVPGDPYETALHEGRRLCVLGIKRMIEIAHDPTTLREAFADGEGEHDG